MTALDEDYDCGDEFDESIDDMAITDRPLTPIATMPEQAAVKRWARCDLMASGPLSADDKQLMGRLADEITGLVCGGICPSMVDVETLARLAARAAESDGV